MEVMKFGGGSASGSGGDGGGYDAGDGGGGRLVVYRARDLVAQPDA